MNENKNTAGIALDLTKLEALARAATPGPWDVNQASAMKNGRLVVDELYVYSPEARNVAIAADIADPATGDMSKANADYIAAANPATVLQLIELARRSTSGSDTCAEMRALCLNCGGTGQVHRADGEYMGECSCEASGSDGTAAAGAEGLPMSEAVRRLTERLKWMLDADQFSNVEQMLRAIADSSACTNSGDQSAPVSRSLICGACGEDRLKKPCSIPRDCSMIAVVHNAPEKIKGFSLGGGLWARHEPRTDGSSGWLLCDETDRLIRAMDRHECNLIDATFIAAENHSAATGSELATAQPPALTGQAAGAVCQPLADERILQIAAEVGLKVRTGQGAIKFARAVLAQQAGAYADLPEVLPDDVLRYAMECSGHNNPDGARLVRTIYCFIREGLAAPSPSAEKERDAKDAARYRVLRQNVAPRDVSIIMDVSPQDIPADQSLAERVDMLCDRFIERAAMSQAKTEGTAGQDGAA